MNIRYSQILAVCEKGVGRCTNIWYSLFTIFLRIVGKVDTAMQRKLYCLYNRYTSIYTYATIICCWSGYQIFISLLAHINTNYNHNIIHNNNDKKFISLARPYGICGPFFSFVCATQSHVCARSLT